MSERSQLQAERYLNHLAKIMAEGRIIRPRGEEVKEVADLQLRVDPLFPFMTFEARKYNIAYFAHEMRWKLRANPYDDSIKKHAKIWENVQNPDGTFNSNYGQYWFGTQGGIWTVVCELIRDPDSRRATIPMLAARHMEPWVKDTVCTEGVGFRIRSGQLDCSVHMRSSDSVLGLGTDIPTFTFLYHLVRAMVGQSLGMALHIGEMIITAMSSHIYSRHYPMIEQMLQEGPDKFIPTQMPKCYTMEEAMYIVANRGGTPITVPDHYQLAKWLAKL